MTTSSLTRANQITNELSRLNFALTQIDRTEIFNGCGSHSTKECQETEAFLIRLEASSKLELVNSVTERIAGLTHELKTL